nr:YbfB/YjiJ family MFS transporter [Pseudomonadota bacterium]
LPLMVRNGQLDVAWGSWIASANYAGYLVGALTAARLRLGARALAVAALVLTAVVTAAMAWPLGAAAWMTLRFAAGVCGAWVFVATASWCLGALAAAGRPSLAGVVYSGVGVGVALAGSYCLVGSAAGASAQSLWLQLGAVALALAVAVAAVLERMPALAPMAPASAPAGVAAGSWPLVICYGAFGFGYILPATFLPLLARSLVDDPRLFGLAWPLFGATAAVSTLLAGWVTRHASRLRVWAASQLLMGIGVLLPSLWRSGMTIALSALFVGATFMVITMLGVQEIRARAGGNAARLVARMTAAFAVGQIGGPVASALLVRSVGGRGLDVALQAGAAGLLGTGLWLWRRSSVEQ